MITLPFRPGVLRAPRRKVVLEDMKGFDLRNMEAAAQDADTANCQCWRVISLGFFMPYDALSEALLWRKSK